MGIKKSGTISLNAEIAQEFKDTNPNEASEFYRGGSLVPDISANSGVPTSDQISLSDFYGASNTTVVSYSIFGGGGTGGYGLDDGGGSGSQAGGRASGIMTQSSYNTWAQTIATNFDDPPSDAFIAYQAGGNGGANGNAGDGSGGNGGSGYRGLRGGNGGSRNNRGEDAPWGHWGAGGGGGGGDKKSTILFKLITIESSGQAGSGGSGGASGSGTATLDLSETYYLILGGAGFSSLGGNYAGGMGCPGVISFSVNLGGTISIFVVEPTGSGDAGDRGTTNVFRLDFVPPAVQSSGVQITRIRP